MSTTTTETKTDFHSSGSNVFNRAAFDENYWNNYLAARPKYSPEFYEIIYNYHDTHNDPKSSYTLAHDVGTGPGQVAGEIAKRVAHVVGSDANPTHVEVARHRLADLHSKGRVAFIESLGEDVVDKVPQQAGSVDFVVGGESFALMDTDRASAGFHKLLRPGGTLAVWYYGRPIFVNEPEVQAIYNKIVTKIFSPTVSGGNDASRAMWKRSTEIMASWLDNIEFPSSSWEDVQRLKWNSDSPMEFFLDEACSYSIDRTSVVTPEEKVVEKQDKTWWAVDWEFKDVKRFVLANVPSFTDDESKDPELAGWWKDLANAMGGDGSKKTISWPVVLVLATRK